MPYIKPPTGIRWFYQVEGKGEPLIFLHGWAGDLNFWQGQRDFFKQRFTVILFDLPGHGRSQWKKCDLNQIAEDLNYILENLKIAKATIIGASFGGLLALKFTSVYPAKIKRLILVGANAKFTKSKDYNFGLDKKQIRNLDNLLEKEFPGVLEIFFRSLFTEEERQLGVFSDTWLEIKQRRILPQKDALKEFLLILEKEDLRESLPKIKVPVLIVSGREDYISGPQASFYLKERLKNSCLEIMDNCGHVPFMTRPQIFNRIVSEFIKAEHD